MASNHLVLCRHLLLLPSIFPSIRVFSNKSILLIRCPKYWNFNFSISPSNEHPGLISFRMDWLDLLAVEGTVKSFLQHHNSKAKDLHDPDNHDGVITHLEPDILECEVKWALGSITMNKTSGGDGIPLKLFQILKDDTEKVLHSICQQIWKTTSGHRSGKGQFSFQSPKKAMPKNAQTTTQLQSSNTLVK